MVGRIKDRRGHSSFAYFFFSWWVIFNMMPGPPYHRPQLPRDPHPSFSFLFVFLPLSVLLSFCSSALVPGPHLIQSIMKPSMLLLVSLFRITYHIQTQLPIQPSSSQHTGLFSSLFNWSPIYLCSLFSSAPSSCCFFCLPVNNQWPVCASFRSASSPPPLFLLYSTFPLSFVIYALSHYTPSMHRNNPFSFILLSTRSRKNITEGKKPLRLGCSFLSFIYSLHSFSLP